MSARTIVLLAGLGVAAYALRDYLPGWLAGAINGLASGVGDVIGGTMEHYYWGDLPQQVQGYLGDIPDAADAIHYYLEGTPPYGLSWGDYTNFQIAFASYWNTRVNNIINELDNLNFFDVVWGPLFNRRSDRENVVRASVQTWAADQSDKLILYGIYSGNLPEILTAGAIARLDDAPRILGIPGYDGWVNAL